VAAKPEQFTVCAAGKGQFLRRNRGNLAKEIFVRRISTPDRVAGVSQLCNDYRANGLGISAEGSVALVLASDSVSLLPGSRH